MCNVLAYIDCAEINITTRNDNNTVISPTHGQHDTRQTTTDMVANSNVNTTRQPTMSGQNELVQQGLFAVDQVTHHRKSIIRRTTALSLTLTSVMCLECRTAWRHAIRGLEMAKTTMSKNLLS